MNSWLLQQYLYSGIHLKDGSYEPMYSPIEDFARIVRDNLGPEAELKFRSIVSLGPPYWNDSVCDVLKDASFILDDVGTYIASQCDDNEVPDITEIYNLIDRIHVCMNSGFC